MKALAYHRPCMATVIDWEQEEQLPDVLSWAEEAAQHVGESVLIVPKVPGCIGQLPRAIGDKRIVLAYSVPTSYGGSPLHLLELADWPVHLLGGSPHRQMELYRYLRCCSEVVSVDGNMTGQQARRGRFWRSKKGTKGHWVQLSESGDYRERGVDLECFRLSLEGIKNAWRSIG